jgi:hypothetical protein
MSQFDKRKKGFEQKHSRDQEFNFKVQARRNKLLGEWAAKKLGLDGAAAVAYAKEVIVSDFDEPGDDDVLQKVFGDLEAKGLEASEHLVRKEMDKLLEVARSELSD